MFKRILFLFLFPLFQFYSTIDDVGHLFAEPDHPLESMIIPDDSSYKVTGGKEGFSPEEKVIAGQILVQFDQQDPLFQPFIKQTRSNVINLKGQLKALESFNVRSFERLVSDPVINKVKARISLNRAPQESKAHRLEGLYILTFNNLTAEQTILLADELSEDPMVLFAEPDYRVEATDIPDAAYEATYIPDDPSYEELWGLKKIDMPEVWDTTTGSDDVIVAVIDTGVDYTHPDLSENILRDNDGKVMGYDYCNDDDDPMDDHFHGTHVAGTIGARGNNNMGVAGINWNVKIMPLKFLGATGRGSTSDAVLCVEFATAHGAHIMNNSWGGGGFSQALLDAIVEAEEAGILFVAAAGNDSTDSDQTTYYPQGYDSDNVLSIASTTCSDELSEFSNYGKLTVDLAAPGSGILSTKPDNSYGILSGTSMATPHVSGAAAILKALHPEWQYGEIKSRLMETVTKLEHLSGKTVSGGRLNLLTSITESTDREPPQMTFSNLTENYTILRGERLLNGNIIDNDQIKKIGLFLYKKNSTTDPTLVKEENISFAGNRWEYLFNTLLVDNLSGYYLEILAYDQMNNIRAYTKEIAILNGIVDTEKPFVGIIKPESFPLRYYTLLKGYALDNISLKDLIFNIYKINGSSRQLIITENSSKIWGSWYSWWDTRGYPDGDYQIETIGIDSSLNQVVATLDVTVQNTDTTPPEITLLKPEISEQPLPVTGDLHIKLRATDNSTILDENRFLNGIIKVYINIYKITDTGTEFIKMVYAQCLEDWNYYLDGTSLEPGGTYRLEAYARDRSFNKSELISFDIAIQDESSDLEKPVVEITSPDNNTTVTDTVMISGTTSDNFEVDRVELDIYRDVWLEGMLYKLEYTAIADGTDVWEYQLDTLALRTKNWYQIIVRAYDTSGLISEVKSIYIYVQNTDDLKPQVVINDLYDGQEISDVITVTASLSDNIDLSRYKLFINRVSHDGYHNLASFTKTIHEKTTDLDWPFDIDTGQFSDGEYLFGFNVYDKYGLYSSKSVTVTINNDNIADSTLPDLEISTPVENQIVNDELVITGTAYDAYGVAKIEIGLFEKGEGGEITPIDRESYTYTFDHSINWEYMLGTSGMSEGEYLVKVHVTDWQGNVSEDKSVSVIIDHDIPTILIIEPVNNFCRNPLIVSGEASDNELVTTIELLLYKYDELSGWELIETSTLDPPDGSLINWSYTFGDLENAQYKLSAVAMNNRNTPSAPGEVIFNIDGITPTLEIIEPAADATLNSPVNVKGEAQDDIEIAEVELKLFKENDSGAFELINTVSANKTGTEPVIWDYEFTLPTVGTYRVTAVAYDKADNPSPEESVIFHVIIPGQYPPFIEDFEDGNIDDWGIAIAGLDAQGAEGTEQSIKVSGYGRAWHALNYFQPGDITFSVKFSTVDINSKVYIGTTNDFITRIDAFSGVFRIASNTSLSFGSFIVDTWYKIELKNIDWETQQFDVFLDGNSVLEGVSFYDGRRTPLKEIRIYNYSSNCESWIDEITINGTIADDRNNPVLSTDEPADNAEVISPVLVQGSAIDDVGISKVIIKIWDLDEWWFLREELATINGNTYQASLVLDEPIQYRIYVTAEDTTGNRSTSVIREFTVIDDIPDETPAIMINEPVNDSTITNPVTVSGEAGDDELVTGIELSLYKYDESSGWELLETVTLDPDDDSVINWSHTFKDLESAQYKLSAVATDNQDNLSEPADVIFYIDEIKPTLEILEPAADASFEGITVNVNGTAQDNREVKEVELKLFRENDSGTFELINTVSANITGIEQVSWDYEFPLVTDGTYQVTAVAYDGVDNPSPEESVIFHVIIPQDHLFEEDFEDGNIDNWGIYSGAVLDVQGAEGTGQSLKLPGGGRAAHTLDYVQASDVTFSVKFLNTDTRLFLYIGPGDDNIITLYARDGNFYINDFAFGSYSADVWYKIELKNIDWETEEFDIFLDGSLAREALSFYGDNRAPIKKIYMGNYSGNTENELWIDEIIIDGVIADDKNKPVISIDEPADNAEVSSPVLVRGSVFDDAGIAGVKIRIDKSNGNGGWIILRDELAAIDGNTYQASIILDGPDQYSITVTAEDTTGNVSDYVSRRFYVLDPATGSPDMAVSVDDAEIESGTGSYDFGCVEPGYSGDFITFTIGNTGPVDLHLTGDPPVQIAGENALDFVIGSQPGTSIAPGSITTFTIRFAPTSEGPARLARVSIPDTDPDADESPYTFTISGCAETVLDKNLLLNPGADEGLDYWSFSDSGQETEVVEMTGGNSAFSVIKIDGAAMRQEITLPRAAIGKEHYITAIGAVWGENCGVTRPYFYTQELTEDHGLIRGYGSSPENRPDKIWYVQGQKIWQLSPETYYIRITLTDQGLAGNRILYDDLAVTLFESEADAAAFRENYIAEHPEFYEDILE